MGAVDMCKTHFCACITYAQNERALQLLEHPDRQPSEWDLAARAPVYCCLLSCGAHCLVHQSYRTRMRSMYRIKLGPYGEAGDCLLSW
jgi:hypothetical protein